MNPVAISDNFCRNELMTYTVDVCRCTTPDGKAVKDLYKPPTSSPAPGGPPNDSSSHHHSGGGDRGSSGCSALLGGLWIGSLLSTIVVLV